jgi:hypothetical protein
MNLRLTAVAFLHALLLVQHSSAQEDPNDTLVKALKQADLIFTSTIDKVNLLGQTSSIPPSTFGNVTFQDTKALRGKVPETATFSYSFRRGTTKNLDLKAAGQVLVAVKQKGVLVVVPATEPNLALAKQVIEGVK